MGFISAVIGCVFAERGDEVSLYVGFYGGCGAIKEKAEIINGHFGRNEGSGF